MKLKNKRKEWNGFKLWRFSIHRKEQWDMDDYIPFVCVHYHTANRITRIFCI